MATQSSVLAWRIPGTGEPGGLPSMGSHRVGHDWSDLAAAAIQETWVRSLGWEDPLEKELATHSSILAWRIPWTEDTGGLQSKVFQRVGQDWATNTFKTSLLAQTVKCLSAMRGTQVCSVGGEALLEKDMATHSSILAQKIPWMEEPGRLQSMELQRVGHDWAFTLTFHRVLGDPSTNLNDLWSQDSCHKISLPFLL